MKTRPHRLTAAPILAALIGTTLSGGCLGLAAFGQRSSDPGVIELSDEPFRIDSVGLVMRLPIGASAQATRVSGRSMVQVRPAPSTREDWVMIIETRQTSNSETTIKDVADQTISLLQGSYGVTDADQTMVLETKAKVFDRTPNLTINGAPAERFYVSVPTGSGGSRNKERDVRGFTVFKPTPTEFVVFELRTPQDGLARARRAYETTIATASFESAESITMSRGAAVISGAALFSSLMPSDYDQAIETAGERFYRLYKPARSGSPSDAEEIGYRIVKFWKGQRGELDPRQPRSSYSASERQEGYLARVRGRILTPQGVGDTDGLYFMTLDRREEAWTVNTSVKDKKGNILGAAMETGARSGDSMTVTVNESGQPEKINQPAIMGEGYITQVETFLLPRLLMNKKAQADLAFYTYQSQSGLISLRRDSVQRDPNLAGSWTITTSYRDAGAPIRSVFDGRGELIRTTMEDGRVWEPIDGARLQKMWRDKGLPTDR